MKKQQNAPKSLKYEATCLCRLGVLSDHFPTINRPLVKWSFHGLWCQNILRGKRSLIGRVIPGLRWIFQALSLKQDNWAITQEVCSLGGERGSSNPSHKTSSYRFFYHENLSGGIPLPAFWRCTLVTLVIFSPLFHLCLIYSSFIQWIFFSTF